MSLEETYTISICHLAYTVHEPQGPLEGVPGVHIIYGTPPPPPPKGRGRGPIVKEPLAL